ncbi:hypothetical protein H8B09_06830 [Paenibacillus sp. PR3]|uniref:Uncharacterized protein n=1 Tax=Paenibacillus terricola TaxID=2763503 RepID=A0ABR8MR49_9BACL|nr:hypothetical protein [Paenibacillus terricola]MBD3918463.1 hypothetical protein [Paenibacillus terricola]
MIVHSEPLLFKADVAAANEAMSGRSSIELAREKGAHPVLITPASRRLFLPNGKLAHSHGDYIPAMKHLAAELEVPLPRIRWAWHRRTGCRPNS